MVVKRKGVDIISVLSGISCLIVIVWLFFMIFIGRDFLKSRYEVLAFAVVGDIVIYVSGLLLGIFAYYVPYAIAKNRKREFWEKKSLFPVFVSLALFVAFCLVTATGIFSRTELYSTKIVEYNMLNMPGKTVCDWAGQVESATIGVYETSGKSHRYYHQYIKLYMKNGHKYRFVKFNAGYDICNFYEDYKDLFYMELDDKYIGSYLASHNLSAEQIKKFITIFHQ